MVRSRSTWNLANFASCRQERSVRCDAPGAAIGRCSRSADRPRGLRPATAETDTAKKSRVVVLDRRQSKNENPEVVQDVCAHFAFSTTRWPKHLSLWYKR